MERKTAFAAKFSKSGRRRSPFFACGKPCYVPDHRRIMMVSSTVARGGCERQILGTAAGLIERGYQVALLAFVRPPSGESLEAEFQKSCIPLHFSDAFR